MRVVQMQLAGLLQMCGRQADGEHIERLEKHLQQARAQIQTLSADVSCLRTQKVLVGSVQPCRTLCNFCI